MDNTHNELKHKFNLNLLKKENGNHIAEAPNEQEFIDQEFIPNDMTNTFIIDLMGNQVFQKDNVCRIPSDITSVFNVKESGIQVQDIMTNHETSNRLELTQIDEQELSRLVALAPEQITYQNRFIPKREDEEFLELNAGFLASGCNKLFSTNDAPSNTTELLHHPNECNFDVKSANLPAIAEKRINIFNGFHEKNSQIIMTASIAKKTLPHKKRISHKLKTVEYDDVENPNSIKLNSGNEYGTEMSSVVNSAINDQMDFSCELCNYKSTKQLEFFAHLKEHYEPPQVRGIQQIAIDSHHHHHRQVAMQGKEENLEGIVINFVADDFHNEINQKHLNRDNTDTKEIISTKNYHQEPNDGKNSQDEEVEFSDSEDMLDGIRNVVDKVSIEDTCDAMDIMTQSILKRSWLVTSPLDETLYTDKNVNNQLFTTANIIEYLGPLKSNAAPQPTQNENIDNRQTLHNAQEPELMCTKIESTGSSSSQKKPIGKRKISKNLRESKKNKKRKKIRQIITENDPDDPDSNIENQMRRQFICIECNRRFNSLNALKYHCQTHTGERPHQCDACSKSFFALGALKAHKRTHTGDKPFACEHCNRKFRQWGDLKSHKVSLHSDERSHQCEFCGKAFARKYSLVVHRRIHTCERNYKCEFCSKTFRAGSYLQNHRKIHTGEKPHQCSQCTKRFRVYCDLTRHMKTHGKKKSKTKSAKEQKRK